jgi:hypothetical protein
VQVSHQIAVHRCRQADVEVQTERTGDLVGEELAQRPAGRVGVPDQLGFVPAQRQRVIPVPATRRPRRSLGRQCRRQGVPVAEVGQPQRRVQCGQPGLVGQQLPHGHLGLAGLGELRPVVGHLGVVVDQPTRSGHRHRKGGNTFRCGKHVDHGVALPRGLGEAVAIAAPQVDHLETVAIHRDGGADIAVGGEVRPECIGNFAVPLVGVASDQIRWRGDLVNH